METLITHVIAGSRGKPMRTSARVSGALLAIGRASRCQIHLRDPRIALEHAQIAVSEAGAVISAPRGRIKVNGKEVDSAQLVTGDQVEVGPFVIEVVAPRADVQLALVVTQGAALSPDENPLRRIVRRTRPFPRRRLSYALFIAVLLGALGAPVALDQLAAYGESTARPAAGARPLREFDKVARAFLSAWSPGPLMQSHQVFGADCRSCHAAPFDQVRDQRCLECHARLPEHTPPAGLDGPRGPEFAGLRCAQCHRDHKGRDAVVRAQDMCAECHRDIHQWSAKAASDNVADFAREHPPFRLSLPDPSRTGQVQRVRQAPGKPVVEHSNIKFSHKAHLDPAGLRTPGGRKRLVCADCHTPNGDGMLMAPVSMKKHCESCHALTFDPAESRRPLPHGPVEQVAETLREFYARQALGRPLPRDAGSAGAAARPGTVVLDFQERQNVLAGANRQAQGVLDELFGKRAVCSLCHEVARIPEEPHWTVAPVRFASVWMPRARFTHARHSTMRCISCHDIARSTRAAEVAMPDIVKCRECHVGARAQLGKVTSNCAACHGFHAGAHDWQDRTASGETEVKK